ncbi:MAG: STAS domain-containing protein [Niabella sp.]
MQVKIDTKEKFHVITPLETALSATMADGMDIALLPFLQNNVKNVVLNMQNVQEMDEASVEKLLDIQQRFYEASASFILCDLTDAMESFLTDSENGELLNVAPTESEAWDIVQMEEIERELLDGE